MNAKGFFHLSAGVLCLILAFAIGRMTAEGPTSAVAGYVDQSACGIKAVDAPTQDILCLLDEDGGSWAVAEGYGWENSPSDTPPVSVSEIKFWTRRFVVTTSDEVLYNAAAGWMSLGFWPGGEPSKMDESTWSELKAEFN